MTTNSCTTSCPAGSTATVAVGSRSRSASYPKGDPDRVAAARGAIGDAGLFVDANGAFSAKRALALAERIAKYNVTWFEEPVSSDDLPGLMLMRERAP
ncbi:MAG: enolase C-terminal domain-like protein, partial [Stellaceae bacterium]